MWTQTANFEEALRAADELTDYDTSGSKRFYVLRERPERTGDRVRLTELGKVLPLWEIRRNWLQKVNRETYFVEAEGSFFPDFIEENGVYLVSLKFFAYLKSRLTLGNIAYNRIILNVAQENRSEEYVLLIPEMIDAVLEGSGRFDKNNILEFLEIDEAGAGRLEIFRIKDFPHLIITQKLNRLEFAGYECVRIENFLDYEGERDRKYRERLEKKALKAVVNIYEPRADATGDINYRFSLRRLLYDYPIQCEIERGLQALCQSGHGFPLAVEKLSDRFLLLYWSWQEQTMEVAPGQAEYFGQPMFTVPAIGPVVEFINQLPPALVELARNVCWETILNLMITESQIFGGYPEIRGEKRFRVYLHSKESRSLNPALIFDYQSPLQQRLEQATIFQDDDLTSQDLREFDFSGKCLSGKKIEACCLRRAKFNHSILTEAEFINCDLTGADFSRTQLEGAKFTGCYLGKSRFYHAELSRAQFSGSILWQASFIQSNLSGAVFEQLNLDQVYFYRTKLGGAIFQIQEMVRECVFILCDLKKAVFEGLEDETVIIQCDFRHADLSEAQFAVEAILGSNFIKAKLTQASFSSCNQLVNCDFRFSSCVEMNLEGVTAEGCNFSGVDLSWMKTMRGVEFRDCDFTRASLAGFEFGGYLSPNLFEYTDLSQCNLEGVDLKESMVIMPNLSGAKLKGASFNEKQLEFIEFTSMQLREIEVTGEKNEEKNDGRNGLVVDENS